MPLPVLSHWTAPIRSGNWKFTAFGLAVVTFFLSATWVALNRERQAAENQAMVNSANLARAVEEHVVATVRSIDQLLLNIARDYRLSPESFDLSYWITNSELTLQPGSTVLAITDADGTVIMNNTGTTGHAISEHEHFTVQRDMIANGLYISKPVNAKTSGKQTIQFTRRLEHPDGRFAGVAVFGLDPHYFTDFYKSVSVGEHGSISLIGLDGVIRARLTNGDLTIGQSLLGAELFRHLPTSPFGTYITPSATDGIERVISYRSIRDYPLVVSVGLSTKEFLSPYTEFRDQVLMGAAAISILALAVTIVLLREMTRRHDSEMLLETVLAAAPTTIQLKGADLRIIWTNQAYLDFFVTRLGNPVGKRSKENLPDGLYLIVAEKADREVLHTRRTITDIEQVYPATTDRPKRHMLLTKTPIFGPNGEVSQILTIGTNITALRHAESEAAAARDAERAAEAIRAEVGRLLSGMPMAVYRATMDDTGHVSVNFISDNVAAITGRSAAEITGPNGLYHDLRPDTAAEIRAFFGRVLATGESQTEYYLPGLRGVWIRDRARVAEHHADRTEIIGNWTDITREHVMAQQVINSAKLATLGELATGLAHELNQPIAVMSLAAENADDALSEGAKGIPNARARLARIVEQAQRAKNIVSHLRVFGRSDAGPLEAVRLADAINGALGLVSNLLRNEGIQFHIDLPRDLPPIQGRLVLIENVIVNLCVNARDAMRQVAPERRHLRIEASARPRGLIDVHVIDHGGGIPDAVMTRLFEPFFTTKPPGEGTGLGLSISHGMMQSMGGTLSVANTHDGACFTLTLRAASDLAINWKGLPVNASTLISNAAC